MSRVLVTGGAGFIGSHVVDALRRAGHEAVVYDQRPSPWHDRRVVETVIGDLCDTARLQDALEGCDAVAHLAAAADVDEVAADPLAAEQCNARGTACVLQAAKDAGVQRVIYASTIWVYSDVEAAHVDEDTPLLPPAHLYTATKLTGELYCRSYRELYGQESVVLRFGIPYGPRARPAAVVPAFVGRARRGEALTIAGDGAQTRRFVYVEDLADGVVRALRPEAANRTYNLVGARDVSIREVAETVGSVVGGVEIAFGPGRAGDFKGAEISGARAEAELGWTPVTAFDEGVRRYVDWIEETEHVPAPRQRLADALPSAGRVLGPVALASLVVASIAAAGSIDDLADKAPVAVFTAVLGLPIALVVRMDRGAAVTRRVGSVLLGFAVVLLVLLLLPLPDGGPIHGHPGVTLLLVASGAVSGVLAEGGPVPAWRERLSD
ncbi:MAG: UDP-glucose 4-epimerase [Solirubrobacteraceae bacterium]|jgi:UDP-glucose 4-epimerase|nr:UDP-glucose 4-epimerase [Solirubrobacteraceae bacterium]